MAEKPVIKIKGATISQPENIILTDTNFELNKGAFVYLIGKTGSGKSSFLKTLYADLPIKDGKGSIAGYNLKRLRKRQIPYLRRKLGIVFQDFQLLTDRSVKDNLMFVLKATGWKKKNLMEERIKTVLEKVDLAATVFKMPHELSGGEQQRVVIARALLNEPEIILADEPTGNLDPDTSADILKLLVDISKNGTAVIMATHDYAMVNQFPSRIVECKEGRLGEYMNKVRKAGSEHEDEEDL